MKISSYTALPRSPRAALTATALLDAGERLLGDGGFDGLTTTAVAAAAGVSTGTFYTYFPDKHALLAALFAARLDDLVRRVEEVLTADNLLDDGLEVTLGRAVDLVVEGYRGHAPVLRAALPRVPLRDDLRQLYWERHARSVEVVARFVRRGAAAGLMRRGEPEVLAHAVVVITQGLNHPVLLAGDAGLAAEVRAELAAALVALLRP